MLNWARYSNVDLAEWPAADTYYRRILERPSVAKAVSEELALFKAELARRNAA